MPGLKLGYARLSTVEQAQGLTLDQQVDRLKNAGAEKVFIDLMSGLSTSRPQYKKLLALVEKGEVESVFATRMDRLARSASEICRLVDLFTKDGAPNLELLDDPADISSIGGRMQLKLIGVFAESELERIKERTKAGKDFRKNQGLIDVAPTGMRLIGGKLVLDREPFFCHLETRRELSKADLVVELFGVVEQSQGNFYRAWTHSGETFGFWFDRAGLKRLIMNPALRGARVEGRRKTTAEWLMVQEGVGGEALIEPSRHLRLEALVRSLRATRTAPDSRKRHPLAGKVLCGHCGRKLNRKQTCHFVRYECINKQCGWRIPRKRLNSIVEYKLFSACFSYMSEHSRQVAEQWSRMASGVDSQKCESVELKQLQEKRKRYEILLADGDPVQNVIDKIDRNISAIEKSEFSIKGDKMRLRVLLKNEPSFVDIVDLSSEDPVEELSNFIKHTSLTIASTLDSVACSMFPENTKKSLTSAIYEVVVFDKQVSAIVLN